LRYLTPREHSLFCMLHSRPCLLGVSGQLRVNTRGRGGADEGRRSPSGACGGLRCTTARRGAGDAGQDRVDPSGDGRGGRAPRVGRRGRPGARRRVPSRRWGAIRLRRPASSSTGQPWRPLLVLALVPAAVAMVAAYPCRAHRRQVAALLSGVPPERQRTGGEDALTRRCWGVGPRGMGGLQHRRARLRVVLAGGIRSPWTTGLPARGLAPRERRNGIGVHVQRSGPPQSIRGVGVRDHLQPEAGPALRHIPGHR
jgi:hypothetical protein